MAALIRSFLKKALPSCLSNSACRFDDAAPSDAAGDITGSPPQLASRTGKKGEARFGRVRLWRAPRNFLLRWNGGERMARASRPGVGGGQFYAGVPEFYCQRLSCKVTHYSLSPNFFYTLIRTFHGCLDSLSILYI